MRTRKDIGTGKLIDNNKQQTLLTVSSTIHGMVYNAMKLFMEVNPQLFDDCSHEYTESQNNADARKKERQEKWDRLSALAKSMSNGVPPPNIITHTSQGIQGPQIMTAPNKLEDFDHVSRPTDNAGRLAALKLGDEPLEFESLPAANAVR